VSQAKELQKRDDYTGAMKHIRRAVKRIEELIKMKKEAGSLGYDVVKAGFLYQQGSILVAYIEAGSDVFGNILALEINESEDEDEKDVEVLEDEEARKGEEAQDDEPNI
jgi:hypothetical protein